VTAAVLADFGSTFTKVTLVELGSGRLIGTGQSPTTVDSDVMRGFHAALQDARSRVDEPLDLGPKRAASSAAGGLRVAAVGLVEDLTAAAARQVALNAGAKVGLVLHGSLTAEDRAALIDYRPEVLLFCGGTDGGQAQLVLANARMLAGAIETHFIVACNSEIADAVSRELGEGGRRVEVVANVMPQIGELNVEPARAAISEAFVRHVIRGKGLTTAPEFFRDVIMPTPEAVLQATRLVAEAVGDVAVVDIGGATTDVDSATRELTGTPGVEGPLLPTLPVLRTVQGDLGLRSNAISVLDTDREWLVQRLDEATLGEATKRRCEDPGLIADSRAEWNLDEALATSCCYHALRRHCGRLSVISGPGQPARIRTDGPDLREVRRLIGTGGILVRSEAGEQVLRDALGRLEDRTLSPRNPAIAIDRHYVLAAAGLLADVDRDAAIGLVRGALLGEDANRMPARIDR
jgi:uncharacterized protein (TIGR01319 family)